MSGKVRLGQKGVTGESGGLADRAAETIAGAVRAGEEVVFHTA
jgi:hypothetical protein